MILKPTFWDRVWHISYINRGWIMGHQSTSQFSLDLLCLNLSQTWRWCVVGARLCMSSITACLKRQRDCLPASHALFGKAHYSNDKSDYTILCDQMFIPLIALIAGSIRQRTICTLSFLYLDDKENVPVNVQWGKQRTVRTKSMIKEANLHPNRHKLQLSEFDYSSLQRVVNGRR